MLTQYYIPGQPQKNGNGNGGLMIFLIFFFTVVAIGAAYYKTPIGKKPERDTQRLA
jgi:hypothetical protein